MTFNEIKERLSQCQVGIAGCGGLGSNCAQMLLRTGIKKLILADYDVVTENNLNRQFFFYDQINQKKAFTLKENLLRINPFAQIEAFEVFLTPEKVREIFSTCDAIVEAFDLKEHKLMIIETVETYFPEKLLVSVSGLAGLNHLDKFKVVRNGNLVLIGDFMNDVSEENPPLAPKVSIAAALEAIEVINFLLNKSQNCKYGNPS
ncbi:MAG: sulfur carrier protein ThiS adenylyltransferase ThiF [Bacteroidales bacterium]|nr:sulfur carrier protein ThiS adenylyltransferase ThiF [Bacteroidales bacterium]